MIQLIEGDCLVELKKLSDCSVDAIVTDPPYGIDFQNNNVSKEKQLPKILNDKEPFIGWLEDAYRVLKEDSAMLCFTGWQNEHVFREEMLKVGFKKCTQVIWDKSVHALGDLEGGFAPSHETLIFATKGKFKWEGSRPKSVIRQMKCTTLGTGSTLLHPNQKPVLLNSYLIGLICPKGGVVLDPFMGSGSCGIAAKQGGYSYIGMELDPKYFKLASDRINAVCELSTLF